MPVFLGVHVVGHAMAEKQVKDIWSRYKEAAKKHGAEGLKTYYNAEEGRAFCITEAKSAADVDAAHAEINMPTKELIEVQKI